MVLFLPSESSQGVNGSFQTRVDAAAPGVVLAGLAVCANSGMPAKSITTPQCNPWLTTGFMASHLSRRARLRRGLRFEPPARASYASPATDTTNSPPSRPERDHVGQPQGIRPHKRRAKSWLVG